MTLRNDRYFEEAGLWKEGMEVRKKGETGTRIK
jgi:hypothetical protein